MGKIINEGHMRRLEGLINDSHKGTVVLGGKVYADRQFIEPTIVDEPAEDCAMMREEIFGPILPIFGYDEIEVVIDKINSRPKPLAVYLFT